nr:translation initiation factor IF-2-like isoform X2 [Manis javanica]
MRRQGRDPAPGKEPLVGTPGARALPGPARRRATGRASPRPLLCPGVHLLSSGRLGARSGPSGPCAGDRAQWDDASRPTCARHPSADGTGVRGPPDPRARGGHAGAAAAGPPRAPAKPRGANVSVPGAAPTPGMGQTDDDEVLLFSSGPKKRSVGHQFSDRSAARMKAAFAGGWSSADGKTCRTAGERDHGPCRFQGLFQCFPLIPKQRMLRRGREPAPRRCNREARGPSLLSSSPM